jgi:hypothetical protein
MDLTQYPVNNASGKALDIPNASDAFDTSTKISKVRYEKFRIQQEETCSENIRRAIVCGEFKAVCDFSQLSNAYKTELEKRGYRYTRFNRDYQYVYWDKNKE